jgi:hypothetical protein
MKGEEEPSPCTKITTTTIFSPLSDVHPNYNSNLEVNKLYQKVNAMDFGHGFICVCK